MLVPTFKIPGQLKRGCCTWTLSCGSVRELSLASWLHLCIQFIHWACVQYRWCCVSLEERAHLGIPLVWGLGITNNSLAVIRNLSKYIVWYKLHRSRNLIKVNCTDATASAVWHQAKISTKFCPGTNIN